MFSGLCLCTCYFFNMESPSSHSPTGKLSHFSGLCDAFSDPIPSYQAGGVPSLVLSQHFGCRSLPALPTDVVISCSWPAPPIWRWACGLLLTHLCCPSNSLNKCWITNNSCHLLIAHHLPGRFFFFFFSTPVAYGHSQARDWILAPQQWPEPRQWQGEKLNLPCHKRTPGCFWFSFILLKYSWFTMLC